MIILQQLLTGNSTITKLTNSDSTGSNIKGDYSFNYSDSSGTGTGNGNGNGNGTGSGSESESDIGSDGKANYLQFYVLNLLLIIMIL